MLTIQRWSSFTIICLLAIAPVQAKINFSANPIGQGNIEINELGFRLTPLTQDELLPAADHWQALLQTQLVEISELNINIAKADKAQKAGSRYFCESLFWASQPKQAAKT